MELTEWERELLGIGPNDEEPACGLNEVLEEGQKTLDRIKTDTVPKDQSFFVANDLVMFVKNEKWQGQVGVVTLPVLSQVNLKTHVMVRYFATSGEAPDEAESSPAKLGVPLLTHVQNIRWIGNLERFGISWSDLR